MPPNNIIIIIIMKYSSRPTGYSAPVEGLYDGLTLLLALHAREPHAATHAADVTQHARRNDRPVRGEHRV